MRFGVSRRMLVIIAGIIWIFAGMNILRIGLLTWFGLGHVRLFAICESIFVFLLFFNFVFKKLFYKHTRRIESKKEKNCPFAFFDVKGWIMMILMITLGVVIRKFQLLPNSFISVFYVGLSLALIVTGILFLIYGGKKKMNQ